MQAARLLATIKKDKDAARTRLMELDAYYGSQLGRFARVAYFAEPTKSNSVTNPERVHYSKFVRFLGPTIVTISRPTPFNF